MTDTTARVQQWRQRLKNEGKVPLTVYLECAEKLRLEDLAATWHCSVSELTQQALAAFRPGSPAAPGSVTDTAYIRELVREELRTFLDKPTPEAPVTETLPHVPVSDVPQQTSHPLRAAADLDTMPVASGETPPQTDEMPAQYGTQDDSHTVMETNVEDQRPTDATASVPPFNTKTHRLGKLCKHGHEWGTTGQSLRANNKAGYCLACNAALKQAKRQTAPIA